MLTSCILFTTLATNTKGMFEGASKQTPDLKILPRRDRLPPPPVLKFRGPPLKWEPGRTGLSGEDGG